MPFLPRQCWRGCCDALSADALRASVMLKLKGFLLSLARYTRLIKQDAGLHLLSASCGACAPGGLTMGVDWGNPKSALVTGGDGSRQRENYFVMRSSQSAHFCNPSRTASVIFDLL